MYYVILWHAENGDVYAGDYAQHESIAAFKQFIKISDFDKYIGKIRKAELYKANKLMKTKYFN